MLDQFLIPFKATIVLSISKTTEYMLINTILTQLKVLIISLEIIMKVGKYLPLIIGGLVVLDLLFATTDFLADRIIFGIINSLIVIKGSIFVVQLFQGSKKHPSLYISQFKENKTEPIIQERFQSINLVKLKETRTILAA